jgi:hypothetical protein
MIFKNLFLYRGLKGSKVFRELLEQQGLKV